MVIFKKTECGECTTIVAKRLQGKPYASRSFGIPQRGIPHSRSASLGGKGLAEAALGTVRSTMTTLGSNGESAGGRPTLMWTNRRCRRQTLAATVPAQPHERRPAYGFPFLYSYALVPERGAILLLTLVALVSLSIFGAALVSMVFWRSEMSLLEYDRVRAFYIAEAGISEAIYELKTDADPDQDGPGNIASTTFRGGSFQATYNPIERSIASQGTFNDTTRTIQIAFSPQA